MIQLLTDIVHMFLPYADTISQDGGGAHVPSQRPRRGARDGKKYSAADSYKGAGEAVCTDDEKKVEKEKAEARNKARAAAREAARREAEAKALDAKRREADANKASRNGGEKKDEDEIVGSDASGASGAAGAPVASVASGASGTSAASGASKAPGASGDEEDVCRGVGCHKKATVRKSAGAEGSKSEFRHLFKMLTVEQNALVEASTNKAQEVDSEKETSASADYRAVTLKQVQDGVLGLSRGIFPTSLYKKCDKHDSRLYGIRVEEGGVKGTRVRLKSEQDGVVASVTIGEDTNVLYNIRWDDGSDDSTYSTSEVLLYAFAGEGVVSLREDKHRFEGFLCAALNIVYVHVYKFLIQDKNLEKYPKPGVILDEKTKRDESIIIIFFWDAVNNLKANDTVSAHERELMSAGEELMRKIDEELMLGLLPSKDGLLKETDKGFHEKHKEFVKHILRGAHESWKLGRFTSIESCITPVAAGLRSEFPRGYELDKGCTDHTVVGVDRSDLDNCGLGTRSILARASNGYPSEEERRYSWFQHVPLYCLLLLTRPSHLGSIRGNSEHSAKVAPTCKNPTFFRVASKFSSTRRIDSRVQDEIHKSYSIVAAQKRDVKSDIENCDPQHGYGRKHNRGRLDATSTPDERNKQIEMAIDIVGENGIGPMVSELRPDEIEQCWEILRGNKKYWLNKKDEEHLKAAWIAPVVQRLIAKGVTRQTVSTFSHSYGLVDRLTSSVGRSQDVLRCLATKSHIFEGVPRDVIDKDSKTYKRRARSKKGATIHHDKDILVADMYCVLIVICRPLMRKLLELRVDELTKELEDWKRNL